MQRVRVYIVNDSGEAEEMLDTEISDVRVWAVEYLCDALKILLTKSHDYAKENDDLANFRDGGIKGILNRMGDKMRRLIGFIKRQSELGSSSGFRVTDETFSDTCTDLANYALLLRRAYEAGMSIEGVFWSD